MQRNSLACDRCHELKLKCVKAIHSCKRCTRLDIPCRYERTIRKPGRKPNKGGQSADGRSPDHEVVVYPVLARLVPFGVVSIEQVQHTPTENFLCTDVQAARLLEHYYTSPNQEFQVRIIRKVNLLHLEKPRETSPGLLLSLLCLACYMPTENGELPLTDMGHGEFTRLQRNLLSKALKQLQPVFLAEADPTFDDAITLSTLANIATSADEHHGLLPQWLAYLKFIVKQINLFIEPEGFDEESKEERRRLWWTSWIVDRHSSLSLNLRPQFTELDCSELYRPCKEALWESTLPLPGDYESRPKGISYDVHEPDIFGIFVPLASILGDILEYHYLRQHATFSLSTDLTDHLRQSIENNLQTWSISLRAKLGELSSLVDHGSVSGDLTDDAYNSRISSQPKVTIYGRHIYHCMYILLYGKMDFVHMYTDTSWLSSPSFLLAAEHASHCARMAAHILNVDPKLNFMYRFFGTYLLQSSFLFLLLAQKLDKSADNYVLDNCRKNLAVFDAFVKTVNISYQRTFARVLRRTLSRCLGESCDTDMLGGGSDKDDDTFDPELLKYRWAAGYSGLWFEDMGRPKEAKMRKFPRDFEEVQP